MPPTLDELDAEIARQREHMDLHLNGMVIARKVIGELQAIRPYFEGVPAQSDAGRPADAAPDYPETTMLGRIQRSVCADPCQSKVLAKRLGISRSHASGALSRLCQEGLVALRDHVYGPPEGWETAEETYGLPDFDPLVPIEERIRQAVCAGPASALDVAARFGISAGDSFDTLLRLLKGGAVGYCGGLYGPPDDLTKTPAPRLTKQERIWLSACAAPDTAKVIAKRLVIPDQIAASNLSQLCRAGKLSYRNGIYGPPDKAGAQA